jgi:hypothetical protein
MLKMRYLLALMIALILSSGVSLSQGQESIQSGARLVHRYERRCGHSCLQELAIALGGGDAKKSSNTVAVRFCSKESLPLALSTAAASPGYLISILTDSYGYTPERILFLRSEGCLGPTSAVTATEFWAIPQGAALPASDETVQSSQVRVDSLGMEGLIGNVGSYKAALQKLPDRLRANTDAVGIVLGYYYKQPSRVMKQRLREVQRTLKKNGLSEHRYSVRLAPWTGEYGDDDPEPTYPSVFVVKVAKEKDNARR